MRIVLLISWAIGFVALALTDHPWSCAAFTMCCGVVWDAMPKTK